MGGKRESTCHLLRGRTVRGPLRGAASKDREVTVACSAEDVCIYRLALSIRKGTHMLKHLPTVLVATLVMMLLPTVGPVSADPPPGADQIKHIVFILKEN